MLLWVASVCFWPGLCSSEYGHFPDHRCSELLQQNTLSSWTEPLCWLVLCQLATPEPPFWEKKNPQFRKCPYLVGL